jgi:hypothetical protein
MLGERLDLVVNSHLLDLYFVIQSAASVTKVVLATPSHIYEESKENFIKSLRQTQPSDKCSLI